jgi:hypothetical protein
VLRSQNLSIRLTTSYRHTAATDDNGRIKKYRFDPDSSAPKSFASTGGTDQRIRNAESPVTSIEDPWLDAYQVVDKPGKFEVRSSTDVCVLVCSDRPSAEHYVTLLRSAFKAGYRAGTRRNSLGGEKS